MMRAILHSALCLVLALGLALAGLAQAQAGVAMTMTERDAATRSEVIICGADGPRVVVLDAGGRIVAKDGSGHTGTKGDACRRCPACVMAQTAASPAGPAPTRPATRAAEADAFPFNTPEPGATFGLPDARGPPARA